MKKTLKQIVEFNSVAKYHKQMIEDNGIRETKFTHACDTVWRKSVNDILEDYAEKQDNISRKHALEGDKGEILRNENGSYKMSRKGEADATKELKELWKAEKDVEYDIETYVATSFEGHDLTETEKEIFEGFVM